MTLRRVLVALAITTLHQGKEYFGLTGQSGGQSCRKVLVVVRRYYRVGLSFARNGNTVYMQGVFNKLLSRRKYVNIKTSRTVKPWKFLKRLVK